MRYPTHGDISGSQSNKEEGAAFRKSVPGPNRSQLGVWIQINPLTLEGSSSFQREAAAEIHPRICRTQLICSAPPSNPSELSHLFSHHMKLGLSLFSELFRPPFPACVGNRTASTAALEMYIFVRPLWFCLIVKGHSHSCLRWMCVVTQHLGTLVNVSGRNKSDYKSCG